MKNIMKTESEVAMKKLLMLLLIPTILLCGCHANSEKEDVSEYYEELSKAQEKHPEKEESGNLYSSSKYFHCNADIDGK